MMLGEQRELNQLGCNYFAPSFDFLENHQESESEDACLASHATIPYHGDHTDSAYCKDIDFD